MGEKKIKVTDKRLFTPDGELREQYKDLDESEPPAADESAHQASMREEAPQVSPEPDRPPTDEGWAVPSGGAGPPAGEEAAAPTFFDLVGVVAQPIALYLGDAKMPDGASLENLELARLYIDLLELLQQKSQGNLTDQESTFMQDLLYQLRMRYVEKTSEGGDN